MSTFATRVETTPSAAPDPTKHVNYNVGMVLGIDDFNQEFAYLSGRDQWFARDLIGYGTVSGLRVLTENDVKGPRVVVEPGVAVSPRGQLIRVPTAQCAYLNDWLKLDSTRRQMLSRLASPPAPLRAYVVLCYRECPTDKVPIPGEPCRSEDDVMAPSRLVDDFRLELMLDPPGQLEEDALRRFVAWLSQIEVSDTFVSTPIDDILDAIRGAAHLLSSPPEPGSDPLLDFMTGSPPSFFLMNSADLCEYLDAVFRLWVTELRPKCRPDFLAGAHGCSSGAGSSAAEIEECLLLAEVDVPVIVPGGGTEWQVEDPTQIGIDERRRPIVVHLRMLQEMLLCGRREQLLASPPLSGGGPVALGGDVTGPAAATSVERIRGVVVDSAAPAQDQVLTFIAGQWRPATLPADSAPITPGTTVVGEVAFGLGSNAGGSASYSRADHTHGTPPDPIPPHRADPAGHNVAGDVTGTVGVTRVAGIQGISVDPTAPAPDEVLTFRSGQWRPATLPAGSAPITPGAAVVGEVAFGLGSNAGASASYSRADHTHGTPPDPIPPHRADPAGHNVAGDVTGTIGVTRVGGIQGVAVDPAPPAPDEVLTFRAGQWRPTPLPAGPAPITPGTTVTGEVTFGLSSNAGGSAAYSRADHTHGTPPDPIPSHRADANAHNLAGDVSGPVGGATVVGIRNTPVVGTPSDGQVLTFRNNQWQAEVLPPPSTPTDVVEHPPGLGRYFIVAAGIVRCDESNRPPVYNKLTARATNASQVTVRFNNDKTPDGNFQYVVKVLPVFAESFDALAISFIQFLQGGGFQLRITRAGQQIPRDELTRLELMIEVSRFEQ